MLKLTSLGLVELELVAYKACKKYYCSNCDPVSTGAGGVLDIAILFDGVAGGILDVVILFDGNVESGSSK